MAWTPADIPDQTGRVAVVTGGGSGPNALLIAVYIIAALTASEVVKLVCQIWLYRAGV